MRAVANCLLLFLLCWIYSCNPKHYTDALTPEEAIKAFQIDPDFEIQLYAAEPFIRDPVAMTFDELGNVYVVEMPDYPFAPVPGKEQGKIKVLLDTNKDGRVDQSIIFADSLSEATSILPWKGGLIVTAAPDIVYLKDTNGDFRSDLRKPLFSGFFKGNSEAQVSTLRFGVDNWIYASNMGFESHVKINDRNDTSSLSILGMDLRFRLDTLMCEPVMGTAQFGQAIDDWGHRFITENSSHISQVIIPWHNLNYKSDLFNIKEVPAITDHQQDIFQLTKAPYWRVERTRRRNEQYSSQHLTRKEYADNHFTGAAGSYLYAGDQFPPEFYGNYFSVDVAAGIVHRDVLQRPDTSVQYQAKRLGYETSHEFLASTDPWFRPVNVTVGPDGFMYVIDMYRQHIETPFAIPEDLKEDMDFLNGTQLGRIYRIVPKKSNAAVTTLHSALFTVKDWVELLRHPNQGWRLQAQRKLIELQDRSTATQLSNIFYNEKDPRIRIHALYSLEGIHCLKPSMLLQAMHDSIPEIREVALRLAKPFKELRNAIMEGTKDRVAGVSFQALLSAGSFTGSDVKQLMSSLLEETANDKWFRKAVLCSVEGGDAAFPAWLATNTDFYKSEEPGKLKFIREHAAMITNRDSKDELSMLLRGVDKIPANKNQWVIELLTGISEKSGKMVETAKDDTLADLLIYTGKKNPNAEIAQLTSVLVKNFSKRR